MGTHGGSQMVEFVGHRRLATLAQRQGIIGENRERCSQTVGEIGGTAARLLDHGTLRVEKLVHRLYRGLKFGG